VKRTECRDDQCIGQEPTPYRQQTHQCGASDLTETEVFSSDLLFSYYDDHGGDYGDENYYYYYLISNINTIIHFHIKMTYVK
jgi:hypothetical protein